MLPSVHSDTYSIHFGKTAYRELKTFLSSASYPKVFVLVDTNTHRFCLPLFMAHVEGDYPVEIIEIRAGEQHKNIETCTQVWETLSQKGADRKSLLIALGGGMVTDLGGFVATTYMRGIDFINIPTSLLAMVDASLGGKTGVDLGVLKNLVGLISFPRMVVIDSSFLKTLPANQMKSGAAEMFKHGLICDEAYWNELSNLREFTANSLDEAIHRSVKIKNNIVMQDPGESRLRKVLNYGHTLGHAIESCFLNTERQLLHGEAVAVGIVLASYISHVLTGFPEEKIQHIKKVFRSHFNKVHFSAGDYAEIISLLKHDKKNAYGNINFVLLSDIGKPVLDKAVSRELIVEAFEYYKK